jgi:hypothetical protein
VITIFFAVSPLPSLWAALKGDKDQIKGFSKPGLLTSLTCSTTVITFCTLISNPDCVFGCGIYMTSSFCIFFTICIVEKNSFLCLSTLGFLGMLSYLMFNVLPMEVVDTMTLFLNIFSSCLWPLDNLNSLLQTRDLVYIKPTMHLLCFISCTIWTIVSFLQGSMVLTLSNGSGVIAELFLAIGYLYASKYLNDDSILVSFVRGIDKVLFRIPYKLVTGAEKTIE